MTNALQNMTLGIPQIATKNTCIHSRSKQTEESILQNMSSLPSLFRNQLSNLQDTLENRLTF